MKKDIQIKKILEISEPSINVYPIYANPLAILQCHSETNEWLLCNFIQLCSNSLALNFFDFNYKFCPYLKIQRISKDFLQTMNVNFITFIINSIASGYYVYLLVKQSEIKAYRLSSESKRQQDTLTHDMLIYGYDMNQQIFFIADNFVNGKYGRDKCTFQELDAAIKKIHRKTEPRLGFKGNIELIEYYKEEPQSFNLKRVVDSFNDYILSRPTTLWNTMEIRNRYGNRKWYFGLTCYDYMIEKLYIMNKNNIYIQDFHLMWEHKKYLKKIILYLIEKNYIIDDISTINQIDSLVSNALIARNSVIKFYISEKEYIKESIINLYTKMAKDEEKLIMSLIEQLEKNKNILETLT